LSMLAHRFPEERLLLGLSLLALAAFCGALAAPGSVGAFVGFGLTGLGFSGIFPGVMALNGRYGPEAAARTTGTLITGAALGNIVIPWTMAAIVGRAGIGAGMGFYAAMAVVMVGLVAVLPRAPRVV